MSLSEQVLVLNSQFSAIRFADAKRALCLLFKGIAEVVDLEDDRFYNYNFNDWTELSNFKSEYESDKYNWIQCVSMRLAVPRIIRLVKFDKYKRSKMKLNRRNIFARDGGRCQFCGKKFPTSELSLDHVVPKSKGGKLSWTNIVCACIRCNTKKGNRLLSEAGLKLIRQPIEPKQPFHIPKKSHLSWKRFIDSAYWQTELQD